MRAASTPFCFATRRFLLCSALLLSLTSPFRPASAQESLPHSAETIAAHVDEVNLFFTVKDRRGRQVPDLSADDFILLDNGQPPENIAYFGRETDAPLRLAVLIDLSDSVRTRFKFQKRAAVMFLERMVRPGRDSALIIGFGSQAVVAQPFTDDLSSLTAAVRGLQMGGNTALHDSLVLAAEHLSRSGRGRRAMVVISDGQDTVGRSSLQDAIAAVLRAEASVYAITTDPRNLPTPGMEALLALAAATGGDVKTARDQFTLKRAFGNIETELRSQYALAYRPAEFVPDGSYRSIELKVRGRKLKVHSRRGYFAGRRR